MPKRMKVFYDTEFHEDGKTIDLISIGMVREDGQEYYAVNKNCDAYRIVKNRWLMDNVMSSIDHELIAVAEEHDPMSFVVTDPAAKSRYQIATDIVAFTSDIKPEFWAYFGAYDHIALCQLYGKMIDLPSNFPMYTMDIIQEAKRLGYDRNMPSQPGGNHNALDDARWNVVRYHFLRGIADTKG